MSAASAAFESIQAGEVGRENLGLRHSAHIYLAAIRNRISNCGTTCQETVEVLAQLLLNKRSPMEAIELIDKGIHETPQLAVLYYLKATAYAQLEREQEALEALVKAIELDSDFLFKFRLEPDFDNVRNTDAFLALSSD